MYVILQKEKNILKISTKTVAWKIVADPFVFINNEVPRLLVNEIFEARWLYWLWYSNTIKIGQNSMQIPQILSYLGFIENRKGLEQVPRPYSL